MALPVSHTPGIVLPPSCLAALYDQPVISSNATWSLRLMLAMEALASVGRPAPEPGAT